MIHWDETYADYAGVERAQYERYRNGDRRWNWAVWLLTAMVVIILCVAQVH